MGVTDGTIEGLLVGIKVGGVAYSRGCKIYDVTVTFVTCINREYVFEKNPELNEIASAPAYLSYVTFGVIELKNTL